MIAKTTNITTRDEFNELSKEDALLIMGTVIDDENLGYIHGLLEGIGALPPTELNFRVIEGRLINEVFYLRKPHAYTEDAHFVAIPLMELGNPLAALAVRSEIRAVTLKGLIQFLSTPRCFD